MRVLLVGSGGREHALAWKISQSNLLTSLYAAGGNAGICSVAECIPVNPYDIEGLLKFALQEKIDLTVAGPEVPLINGIADLFSENGIKVFGPSASAARLEGSKIFAKEFMKRNGIPTAEFICFSSNQKEEIYSYLKNAEYPVVIKADGPAAGKGVVIADNHDTAINTVKDYFERKIFGRSGESVVIEQFIRGTEASIFAVTDGEDYIILPPAQDHKKIGEGETGKNTGGMGSYAPAGKIVTDDVLNKIIERIIKPTLVNMNSEGNKYKGCLYCGLMIDQKGDPYVIEYNVRFGDPETQSLLPLIKSDFLELLLCSAEGGIRNYKPEYYDKFCCTVVLASSGYPDHYETGKRVYGLDKVTDDCIVFHAGTVIRDGDIYTSGGRVFGVTGISSTSMNEARETAYRNSELINFENKYYRKDIGEKAI